MLSEKQIQDFRELLEQAQNPVFFFDNDVDGLSSFLLLRRFCRKGKGVAIKTFPGLDSSYNRKLHELKPDYIFVLDKPIIAQEFIDEAKKLNIKIVWLDHHPVQEMDKDICYFNPLQGNPSSNEPIAYWTYKISGKKEDQWISMLGCIADWFIPDFSEEFAKENPELFNTTATKDPAKALYETEIGRLAKVLSFALKDRTTAVVKMLRILIDIKGIQELIKEDSKTIPIYTRFKQIDRRYSKYLEKAKQIGEETRNKDKKLLFFQYAGQFSLSGELANEIYYNFPNKIVLVAYIKGSKVNCSIRGKIDVRNIVAKAMEGIEGTSGGHKNACGASLSIEDLPKLKDNMNKLL